MKTLLGIVLAAQAALAQGTPEDYGRAQLMLGLGSDPLLFDGQITPNWIAGENRFWYVRRKPEGKRFEIVDAKGRQAIPAFDHERLAGALSRLTGTTVDPGHLPFDTFEFEGRATRIRFVANGSTWTCSQDSYECRTAGRPESRPADVSFFADAPGLGPSLTNAMTVKSPDGRWEVRLDDQDLVLRESSTGAETRLTTDGSSENGYGFFPSSPTLMIRSGRPDVRIPPSAFWAPDSSKFVAYRVDWRKSPHLTLMPGAPARGRLPVPYTYHAPLAGSPDVARISPYIFDVATKKRMPVQTPPLEWLWYEGGPFYPQWSPDGSRFYFLQATRGFQRIVLKEADASSGETRIVIDESSPKYVNFTDITANWRLLDAEVLWVSERDGWAHLYLYDVRTGALKRQLTSGPWVVQRVVGVGAAPRRVYFYGSGREPSRDPYLKHFYSVSVDDGQLTLLTPEAAQHEISMSPDQSCFVDSYSTVDRPWTTVLRDSRTGRVMLELERGDPEPLRKRGWTPPEAFEAIAADGSTKLYGAIFRPSNFDPNRKYPVVEAVYTWPSSTITPKAWSIGGGALFQPTAELGFIVVTVDARGTTLRGRKFQEVSWKNIWGDEPWQDHVGALRQLARRYPYMDLDRVGIFGHSAGGLDAVHAMLMHPEFYKVGVASSGLHDLSFGMALSTEQWMGFPAGEHYWTQSNVALAGRLQGKLLLVHGDSDPNVHPSATLRLVQALTAANKDFELLILPNQMHALGLNRYLIRRRWDFFVRHLLNTEPPEAFGVGAPGGR